ncbi:hypothetical protein SprV_0602112300 [Sparganum proliferum]
MLTHSPAYFRATCIIQGGPNDTYTINTTNVDTIEHGPLVVYSIIGDSQKHDTTCLLETYLGASVKCETTVTPPMSKYYEVRWIALDPHSSRSLRAGLMTQRVQASDTMISTTLWFDADTVLGDYELVCSFHQIHLRQTLLDTSISQSIAQVTLRLRLNLVEQFKLHPEQSTYVSTNSIVLCQVRSPLNPKPILLATEGFAVPKQLPNPFKISEENTRQGPLVVSCTVQVNKRVSLRLRRSYTVFGGSQPPIRVSREEGAVSYTIGRKLVNRSLRTRRSYRGEVSTQLVRHTEQHELSKYSEEEEKLKEEEDDCIVH